jgi:hypothetical protein
MLFPIIRSLVGYITPSVMQDSAQDNYHPDDGFWPPIPPPPPSRTVKPPYTGSLERPVPYYFAGLRRLLPRNVKTWLDGDVRATLEGGSRLPRENAPRYSEMLPPECWSPLGTRCLTCGSGTSIPAVPPSPRRYPRKERRSEEFNRCGHVECQRELNREVELLREQVIRLSTELRRNSRTQALLSDNVRTRKKGSTSSEGAAARKRKSRKKVIKKVSSSSSFLSSSEASGSGYRPPSPFLTRCNLDYHLFPHQNGRPRTPALSTSSSSPPPSPSLPEFDIASQAAYARARFLYPSPTSLSRGSTPSSGSSDVDAFQRVTSFPMDIQEGHGSEVEPIEDEYPTEQDMETHEDIDEVARTLTDMEHSHRPRRLDAAPLRF